MTTPRPIAKAQSRQFAHPASIKLLAMDVDGVLTDGSIWVGPAGEEFKRFHVRDGFGMRLCERAGLQLAVITGRTSTSLLHRLADLRVPHVIQGSRDKGKSLANLAAATGIPPEAMCFVGDDWPDLPILGKVGYPVAVADAAEVVKSAAAYVTSKPGGSGAVRDVIEHLLDARGELGGLLSQYEAADG